MIFFQHLIQILTVHLSITSIGLELSVDSIVINVEIEIFNGNVKAKWCR